MIVQLLQTNKSGLQRYLLAQVILLISRRPLIPNDSRAEAVVALILEAAVFATVVCHADVVVASSLHVAMISCATVL